MAVYAGALEAVDPRSACLALMERRGETLVVGDEAVDLRETRRIFFVGAGKASFGIARAVEDLLGERLTGGLLVCKHGSAGRLERIRIRTGGHPIPDEAGMRAAREMLSLARDTRPGDLVIAGITGGSSALLPAPNPPLTLEDERETTSLLLSCGANIIEINAVRKHLSAISGGLLACAIHPKARIINLTVSDVIGDPLDAITGPTVADGTTLADARQTLTRYGLWERVPNAVSEFLADGGPAGETPKDLSDRSIRTFILSSGSKLCDAAAEHARRLGFVPVVLSTGFEGESAELARFFASVAGEILRSGQPVAPPCVLIGGGENTVRLDDWHGGGGPNQEFALAAAIFLDGLSHAVALAVDSDGTDGPTEYAGGLVDSATASRARTMGVDLFSMLREHKSTEALSRLGDVIRTGPTGTNVNDLKLLFVAGPTDIPRLPIVPDTAG